MSHVVLHFVIESIMILSLSSFYFFAVLSLQDAGGD
jgi:hypothetical protein